jgi:hypothetical protein
LARIDWIGSFIFTGSATSFLIAVSWGGSQVRAAYLVTEACDVPMCFHTLVIRGPSQ